MKTQNFRSLAVYRKAFDLAMEIFQMTKTFPKEENYELISQMRRSSRSVCASIGEAYRKRQYPAYFVSKSSDGDSENSETRVWLDFALACAYINENEWERLDGKADEIGRLLNHMIEHPEKYQRRKLTVSS